MFDLSDFVSLVGIEEDTNKSKAVQQVYETNSYIINGVEILVREFAFSQTNSGCVWKSSFPLCEYVTKSIPVGGTFKRRIIELGTATGITSIYLKKIGYDITSSDLDDGETTENIKHNYSLNNVDIPHITHTWGSEFPADKNNFDIVIASDIILYENHYKELLYTLQQLMSHNPESVFIMTYKRKAYGEKSFFVMLQENNFWFELVGSKTWCIKKKD